MKIISWNINGIRAVYKKGLMDFIEAESPDIFCLQEIKARKSQFPKKLITLKNYHKFIYSASKRGYSGTAIFSKMKPNKINYGIGIAEHDREGRVITLEYPKFYLVNVYTPNSQRELARLSYRQEWDKVFLKYLKKLEKKKPVIFCGDMNVAHKEIDLARPKQNKKNAGFTKEERTGFSNYIKANFVDTYRIYNKKGGVYTWWTYMFKSRQRNVGWRIDYVCVSKVIKQNVKKSFILSEVMGSDHCPVGIIIDI